MAVGKALGMKILCGVGTAGAGGIGAVHLGLLDSYFPKILSWRLGLPKSCEIPSDETEKTCEISKQEELTGIQFKETAGKTNLTVDNLSESNKITLKIKKFTGDAIGKEFVADADTRFSFTFTGSNDILIKEDSTTLLTLKKGTNPEFKVKSKKLERAWTAETLIGKVGDFSCTSGESAKCTFNAGSGDKKIKVKNDSSIQEATVGSDKLTDGFTVANDAQDYNQGFKFTYAGSSDTTLDSSVTISANSCYEVKYEAGEGKGWHLSKKNT